MQIASILLGCGAKKRVNDVSRGNKHDYKEHDQNRVSRNNREHLISKLTITNSIETVRHCLVLTPIQ